MLYCGIIGEHGIECLFSAKNKRFFIVNLTEQQQKQILDLMRNDKAVEAIKFLEGLNK